MSPANRVALGATGLGLAVTGAVAGLAWFDDFAIDSELWVMRSTGWAAILALTATLAISPLDRWIPKAARVRRALGIASAALATLHGVTTLSLRYGELPWDAVLISPFPMAGSLSWVVLVVLLGTSSTRINKRLGVRHWRWLHRGSYGAALLALQHLMLAPFVSARWGLFVGAVLGLLAGMRVLRWLRKLEPKASTSV